MKFKIHPLKTIAAIILLISVQMSLNSCPKCTQDFYGELLTKRANTLAGKELLEAIKNQSIPGEPSGFTLPSAKDYLSEADEDNISENTGDAEVSGKDKYNARATEALFPFISSLERLIFFGSLLN